MAAPAPLFATVLHLATGHVLAAVSSGGLEPKLADLTAGHLRVRFPDTLGFVNVPDSALTAVRVAVGARVLDHSQHYVVGTGDPPLALGAAPIFNGPVEADAKNKQAIVVWQTGSSSIVESGLMGPAGELPGTRPADATHRLLAYAGGPLHLDDALHFDDDSGREE